MQIDAGGNGQANPGESLQLTLALTNLGPQTAGAVTAVVASEDPLVQVTQPQASFGDLAGGATVWGGPFTLLVDPAAPDGLLAPLRVTASSGNATWTSLVEVPVVAARPVVDYRGVARGAGRRRARCRTGPCG